MESPQVDLNARAHVSHFDAHVSHESCTRFTWTPRTFHMDGAHVSHGTPHMFLQSVESANKAIRTPVVRNLKYVRRFSGMSVVSATTI